MESDVSNVPREATHSTNHGINKTGLDGEADAPRKAHRTDPTPTPRQEQPALTLPPPPVNSNQFPVGARLTHFLHRWMDLFPDNLWAPQVVEQGVKISFTSPPPLTSTPRWIQVPRDPVRAQALREEVKALISKEAIEIVRDPSTPGFYAHVFVVPKPDGRWRPIIDLSLLNTFISAPTFRMETTQNLKRSILPQEFAVSLDLADAYLHVPMHRSTRKFLRFALDGQVFAFRAMPFGLNLSPWIFTRLMDTVMQGCKCSGLGRNSGLEKIRFFSFRLGKISFV
jgi:hypothetical protein